MILPGWENPSEVPTKEEGFSGPAAEETGSPPFSNASEDPCATPAF